MDITADVAVQITLSLSLEEFEELYSWIPDDSSTRIRSSMIRTLHRIHAGLSERRLLQSEAGEGEGDHVQSDT